MCFPNGTGAIPSNASFMKWRVINVDTKSVFFQFGLAQGGLYIIPVQESLYRNGLLLLLAAAYWLVNKNVNWQLKPDSALMSVRLKPILGIYQLFVAEKTVSEHTYSL